MSAAEPDLHAHTVVAGIVVVLVPAGEAALLLLLVLLLLPSARFAMRGTILSATLLAM